LKVESSNEWSVKSEDVKDSLFFFYPPRSFAIELSGRGLSTFSSVGATLGSSGFSYASDLSSSGLREAISLATCSSMVGGLVST
jgi:hypothetical protein